MRVGLIGALSLVILATSHAWAQVKWYLDKDVALPRFYTGSTPPACATGEARIFYDPVTSSWRKCEGGAYKALWGERTDANRITGPFYPQVVAGNDETACTSSVPNRTAWLDDGAGTMRWGVCRDIGDGIYQWTDPFTQTATLQQARNAGSGSYGTFDAVDPNCRYGDTLEHCEYEQDGVWVDVKRNRATGNPIADHKNVPVGLTQEQRLAGLLGFTLNANRRSLKMDAALEYIPPAGNGTPDATWCNEVVEYGRKYTQLDATEFALQWICTAAGWKQQRGAPYDKDLNIPNPVAASDTNKIQVRLPGAITLTSIYCSTDTGSVPVNLDERLTGTPNAAGETNVLAANLICDSTGETATAFNDAGIAGGALLNLQIGTITGSPTILRVHIHGVYQ